MDKTDIKIIFMNILMVSINFYPTVGGIELITENLANEFVRLGHKVTIITNTARQELDNFPFNVLRLPKKSQVMAAYSKCDVFVHQSISLKYIWPCFIRYKPFFIVYHQVGWEAGIKGHLKRFVSHFANNICVGQTTAYGYRLKTYDIIYNAYNDSVFTLKNHGARNDIAFVGRLNKEKGAYILIDAFNSFKKVTHSKYTLNIIGTSKEKEQIEFYASNTEYANDIHFLNSLPPTEIAKILNQHHILAVTSTHPYYEAFGIVVLEGLACGCVVIGADGDGIEEALHGYGLLYRNGDKEDLCRRLCEAAYTPSTVPHNEGIAMWLKSRTINCVAKEYLNIFNKHIQ